MGEREEQADIATLRAAAYVADAEYSKELSRVYGKLANEMRYLPNSFEDAKLIQAGMLKVAADAALHRAVFGVIK